MTWTSTILLCAASSAAVAAPLWFRLSAETARRRLAEAKLAAIHNQHVNAGKQSHRAIKALQAKKLEELRQANARRDSNPLDRGSCYAPEVLTAREGSGSPAPLSSSCAGSAAAKMAGSRTVVSDMPTGSGRGQLPRRKRRPHSGASAAEAAGENRAVESIPADFMMKGA